MTKQRLLVIDDDNLVTESLRLIVRDEWLLVPFSKPVPSYYESSYGAAFVDMHLTGNLQKREGLIVIKDLRALHPDLEIVAMSGNLDLELMEAALTAGATRFIAKPLVPDEVLLTLSKIEAHLLLKGAFRRASHLKNNWVGDSPVSRNIKKVIASLVNENGPILIEGESGTGKEVVAQLIHELADDRPWIVANVAAIPENLFESEIFGHVKGAFTGADQNKMGLAEAAQGGDLFLDEIETLSLTSQAKLLRFLESGEIRRVGGKDSTKVKVRLIAATNQNLEKMAQDGKFREDLLWRLSGKKIFLAPLRERRDDISSLVDFFIQQELPRRTKQISKEALDLLQKYDWPGNVREVRRVIEQACLHSALPIIRPEDVKSLLNPRMNSGVSIPDELNFKEGLNALTQAFEASVLKKCLETYNDVDKAAEVLQISRSSIYKKMKDHGIT